MSEPHQPYKQLPYADMLAAQRASEGVVHLDVLPPRDAPLKRCMAYLFASPDSEHPQGSPQAACPITPEQARELLAAGATWSAPAHLRAELVPEA
jgi:hypothetical protein